MSNRKVTYLRLQTGAYVMNIGDLGAVFPSQSKTLENLAMTALPTGIEIVFSYKGLKKDLLIPYGNVIIAELAPEEIAPAPSHSSKKASS